MSGLTRQDVLIPEGEGPFPGVVLGAEAWGVNAFIREVQQRLASLGIASLVPDYYRGRGPSRVDYEDFTEVHEAIRGLDFTRAAHDLVDAIDLLRASPRVDPSRVATWGYCTGATLAWLAACQRGDIAATVLFYPSQPTFDELGPGRPVHPVDLVWQLTCPTLFITGAEDHVLTPEVLANLHDRIDRWQVTADVKVYPDAGHAFSSPGGPLRNDEADRRSWVDALAWVGPRLGLPSS